MSSRAVGVLARARPQAADPAAVDDLTAYLEARAEWIPNYRLRRRQRRFIGNGLGEKANDRIVARRQKRKGMHGSVLFSSISTLAVYRHRPSSHAAERPGLLTTTVAGTAPI